MMNGSRSRVAAFTVVELMIVVALVAIIITLAAPSLRDMILLQRLRGVNAQVVADLTFARSEAVSRGTFVQVKFRGTSGPAGMTCYTIYARENNLSSPQCDCTAAAGSRCTDASLTEIRTVQVPSSESVRVVHLSTDWDHFTISPRTGGISQTEADLSNQPLLVFLISTSIDSARRFNDYFGVSGRTGYCVPAGSTLAGEPC